MSTPVPLPLNRLYLEQTHSEPAPGGGIGYGGGLFAVNGAVLVYAAQDGRLYRIDMKTGAQQAITPMYEGVAAPAISPDVRYVAFLAEQDGGCNLLLVDAAGAQSPVRLTDHAWYVF